MAPTLTVDSYAHLETPPPKWGDVCEARWGDQLEQAIEGKTPTEAGRCLRDRHQQGRRLARETPTEAGRCLRGDMISFKVTGSHDTPPPKWVHRHLPPNFQCPATTIAHNSSQMAQPRQNPRQGPGERQARLGVQAFNSLIQEVNSRFVRVRTKPSLL